MDCRPDVSIINKLNQILTLTFLDGSIKCHHNRVLFFHSKLSLTDYRFATNLMGLITTVVKISNCFEFNFNQKLSRDKNFAMHSRTHNTHKKEVQLLLSISLFGIMTIIFYRRVKIKYTKLQVYNVHILFGILNLWIYYMFNLGMN